MVSAGVGDEIVSLSLHATETSLSEIAEHSGLSVGEVRFALLYARVLVR